MLVCRNAFTAFSELETRPLRDVCSLADDDARMQHSSMDLSLALLAFLGVFQNVQALRWGFTFNSEIMSKALQLVSHFCASTVFSKVLLHRVKNVDLFIRPNLLTKTLPIWIAGPFLRSKSRNLSETSKLHVCVILQQRNLFIKEINLRNEGKKFLKSGMPMALWQHPPLFG